MPITYSDAYEILYSLANATKGASSSTHAAYSFNVVGDNLTDASARADRALVEYQNNTDNPQILLDALEFLNQTYPGIFDNSVITAPPAAPPAAPPLNLQMIIDAGNAFRIDMERATVAANRTIGREDASTQLNPARRIANWIIYRSQICGVDIPAVVRMAAQTFLDRWPETFKSGHPGKGTATCWICGQQIKDGDYSEIEHVLGMRPSAYRFTALCTPTTLTSAGLPLNGWYMLNHVPMFKLKNASGPLTDLDKLLCNVKWHCIYDFFYNYAPAHKCCNRVKGNIAESKMSYLAKPFGVQHSNLPIFIPMDNAISSLLLNIIDKIKEGTDYNCSELKDYLPIFETAEWLSERKQIIKDNYLRPFKEPNPCLEDSALGLLAHTTIGLFGRDIEIIDAVNNWSIEYTKQINGVNPNDPSLNLPGLPFYYNPRSHDEPTFELLAFELGITVETLQNKIDQRDPTYIEAVIQMRRRKKDFDDEKQERIDAAKAKAAATKKTKKEKLSGAIDKDTKTKNTKTKKAKEKDKNKKSKEGGKRRYTKKIHLKSNLRKNVRKGKKSTKKSKKKYKKNN